uniref:Uncharacterized protein AlNc14C32G2967 n=1 Tax=Albugo laibachii Nc14 TaxID=890382 RepID=F0W817_9STRA|nr:conserved hypothetical protein [Albugo laibachii Nc14]|eukprot:CCA17270.1 conserved hypothetical protein [Albugo laibachii Nc14]
MARERRERIPFVWHNAHLFGISILLMSYCDPNTISMWIKYVVLALFLLNCVDMFIAMYQTWKIPEVKSCRDCYALITGTTSGIGREMTYILAQKGFSLILVARREDVLERMRVEIEASYKNQVITFKADLSTEKGIESLISFIEEKKLVIDILINNAGASYLETFQNLTKAQVSELITLNWEAVVHLTRAIIPQMVSRQRGHILNVASVSAAGPMPYMALYSGLKAAVDTFTQALSFELRGSNVIATSFCPGPVNTNFFKVSGIEVSVLKNLPFLMLSSKDCAKAGIEAMFRNQVCAYDTLMSQVAAFLLRAVVPTRLRLMILAIVTQDSNKIWDNIKR